LSSNTSSPARSAGSMCGAMQSAALVKSSLARAEWPIIGNPLGEVRPVPFSHLPQVLCERSPVEFRLMSYENLIHPPPVEVENLDVVPQAELLDVVGGSKVGATCYDEVVGRLGDEYHLGMGAAYLG